MNMEVLEKEILSLPSDQREALIERILACGLEDSETEALAREKAWDKDPSLGINLKELKQSVGRG